MTDCTVTGTVVIATVWVFENDPLVAVIGIDRLLVVVPERTPVVGFNVNPEPRLGKFAVVEYVIVEAVGNTIATFDTVFATLE